MDQSKTVRTRILILSDTHGKDFTPDQLPSLEADVAIHCGDMTDESKISEFRSTINLMRRLNVPLKLIIAGNHDFTRDLAAFAKKVKEADATAELSLIERVYGATGEAVDLFETARSDGIVLLNEGTCHFKPKNGALLTVFASPYTPALGNWGFQYHLDKGRVFPIRRGTEIVITHGPPIGILSYSRARKSRLSRSLCVSR